MGADNNAHGNGAKPGERRGGRKKGVPNKLTALRTALATAALESAAITPLQVMLEAMAKAYYGEDGKGSDALAAFPMARDIAPYMHPRLASVEAKVDTNVNYVVTSEPLNDAEWAKKHGADSD